MVVFERCDVTVEENECVDDDEFKDWIEQKYIVTLINERKFVKNKFNELSLAAFSTTYWLSLSVNSRNDLP